MAPLVCTVQLGSYTSTGDVGDGPPPRQPLPESSWRPLESKKFAPDSGRWEPMRGHPELEEARIALSAVQYPEIGARTRATDEAPRGEAGTSARSGRRRLVRAGEADRPSCELIVGRGGKPDVLVVVRRRRELATVMPAAAS